MKYSAESSVSLSIVILGEEGKNSISQLEIGEVFAITWEKQAITSSNTSIDCLKKLIYHCSLACAACL